MRSQRFANAVATGFADGSVAYINDPADPRVQHMVRLQDCRRSKCTVVVVMSRHRETVEGKDQGVWKQWTPPKKRIAIPSFNIRDCRRQP